MKRGKLFLFLILTIFSVTFISAVTINVPADYITIQEAIDAADPGDTITVDAGTYNEQVLINKPLLLIGLNKPIVTGGTNNYIIQIDGTNDVIIDNFEVNGQGSGTGDNGFDYGILIKDSNDIEIKNSIIKNIWKVSSNGINIEDSTNVDVHHSTISSFHKRGIRYVHSDGKIYNNEIIGDTVDGTSRVQNLVNLWTGSNVEVYENILHNALSTEALPTWDSPAIFVSSYYGSYLDNGNSYANIHDNEIYDSDTGIVITSIYSTTDTSSADITNNNLYNLKWSISFEKNTAFAVINYNSFNNIENSLNWPGTSILDAENNWWGACNGPGGEGPRSGHGVIGNINYDPWDSRYLDSATELIVNPVSPDGTNGWYKKEPEFTLTNYPRDGTSVISYYQWTAGGIVSYSGTFGLENIPNLPLETAGILGLNWWSDSYTCDDETSQDRTFKVDLTNPVIMNLQPANEEEVVNDFQPTISAYLDEVHQSNSGIDKNSILMKVDNIEVNPSIISNGIDATITYNPTTNLAVGTHEVYVYVKDNAGRGSSLTWEFDIVVLVPEFDMTISAPVTGLYDSRRIPFEIDVTKDVTLEYINYDDARPTWRRLCTRCDEYGLDRLRTKTLLEGENDIKIRATDLYLQTKEESFIITIDSRAPRISRTEPKRNSYISGNTLFTVRYTEDNLQEVKLLWGTTGESKILTGCESGPNKECSITLTQADLTPYEGETMEYWFEVSDSINTVQSRKTTVNVDTIAPILTLNEPINGETFRRRVPFNIEITEDVTLEYQDLTDANPRWRRLCSRCDEYGLERVRTKSFRQGTHNLEIRAIDNAGNSDTKSVSFEINYFLL